MHRIPAHRIPAHRIRGPLVPSATVALALLLWPNHTPAQSPVTPPPPAAESDFTRHLDELTGKLDSMRQQLIESQKEMDELRSELHSLRAQLAEKNQADTAARDADALRTSVTQLQDETDILQSQVKQHDQTKIETASKFPVRINGTVLITSIFNSANADNINLPLVALPPSPYTPQGSLSESASQTMLGFDASGPHLWGANSYADLSVDFWGGSSTANYTSAAGALRLRTAHARLQWPNRSLGVQLDRPLLSPGQPTSWITLAEPALSWSGNLWIWSPQLVFQQAGIFRHFNFGVGLIDPASPNSYLQGQSSAPSASERSRQPGYESRIGFSSSLHDLPINFGVGGYYSRQSYPYGRTIDAWAGTADWDIALHRAFRISGQFYRGKAIGGLGGGAFKDYVSNTAEHYFDGLNAAGGWVQARFPFTPTLEANVSTGVDNAYAADLRDSDQAAAQGWYAGLARNRTLLANLVYRPRTYLLLSTEFRQIESRWINGQNSQDRVFGVSTGYIF
jgi:regulator of replication initiation timing